MFILVTEHSGKTLVAVERIQKITTYEGKGSITFMDSNGGGGVSCKELPEEILAMIAKAKAQ